MGNAFRFNTGPRALLIVTALTCGMEGCGADPRREAGLVEVTRGAVTVSPAPKLPKKLSKRAAEVRVRQGPAFPAR
jgi:hypothetical protein